MKTTTTLLTLFILLAWPALGAETGRDLLQKHDCSKCHQIKALGIDMVDPDEEDRDAPDLSQVGKTRSPRFLKGFLKKKISQTYKGYHDRKYRGSDEDFLVLIDLLMSLKGEVQPTVAAPIRMLAPAPLPAPPETSRLSLRAGEKGCPSGSCGA